jgi:hypothetical protein
MSLTDVVAALAAHWDDTVRHLSSRDLALVDEAIHRIEVGRGDRDAAVAAADLTGILAARLPNGHPVLAAIAANPRLAGTPADWARVAGFLQAIPVPEIQLADRAGVSGEPGLAAGQDPDARLLAAPALSAPEVREQGGDPDRADLIRLLPGGGAIQLPSFQFGLDGQPVPVVLAINRLLEVAEDPWGVADWWLGRNAWLDGIPADLLGRVDDALLVLAAQAEFPEE